MRASWENLAGRERVFDVGYLLAVELIGLALEVEEVEGREDSRLWVHSDYNSVSIEISYYSARALIWMMSTKDQAYETTYIATAWVRTVLLVRIRSCGTVMSILSMISRILVTLPGRRSSNTILKVVGRSSRLKQTSTNLFWLNSPPQICR